MPSPSPEPSSSPGLPSAITTGTVLLAPVDAIVSITSGRNTTGHSSGHHAKYTLDNDPDTWWLPCEWITSSLYYDLGTITFVNAIVFWLHNYNENYNDAKAWRVSYSHDNISYTTVALKEFEDFRSSYNPIVVDLFDVPTSARYWRLQMINFEDIPQTIRPEIGAVWFMNDYTLPFNHQRPENNRLIYHNNETATRSGIKFASPAGVGQQRVLQRKFIFVDSDNWDSLNGAYNAARGKNLPVVMQTEYNSNDYYALQFETPLKENRLEYDYWNPALSLRELGHKRITYDNKSLTTLNETISAWHFRGNGNDDSGSGNHLTETTISAETDYTTGITEPDKTAYTAIEPQILRRNAADATDFDFGIVDFSMEMRFRIEPGTLQNNVANRYSRFLFKIEYGPARGFQLIALNGMYYYGTAANRISLALMGTTGNAVLQTAMVPTILIDDGDWHYLVATINRSTPVQKMYLDGELVTGNLNTGISGVGNIDAPTGDLDVPIQLNGVRIDDMIVHRELVLTASEIADRFTAFIEKFGNWSM